MLDSMGHKDVEPRIIDFDRDASRISLGRMAELYAVKNNVNDVFTLQLIYHKGKVADPRLGVLASYIDALGTDSLTSQQLRRACRTSVLRSVSVPATIRSPYPCRALSATLSLR